VDERHASLNFCHGTVTTDSLDGMTDKESQTALANQTVSRVNRINGKRDGKAIPLCTVFLTFEVLTLPSNIHVGYEGVSVRP
jgi:hypothetical protein